MWNSILENLLIMILTIVILLAGGYLFLVVLGWGLKLKSKDSEQVGLTNLWIENQNNGQPRNQTSENNESPHER